MEVVWHYLSVTIPYYSTIIPDTELWNWIWIIFVEHVLMTKKTNCTGIYRIPIRCLLCVLIHSYIHWLTLQNTLWLELTKILISSMFNTETKHSNNWMHLLRVVSLQQSQYIHNHILLVCVLVFLLFLHTLYMIYYCACMHLVSMLFTCL
jgi:hypothetical protein